MFLNISSSRRSVLPMSYKEDELSSKKEDEEFVDSSSKTCQRGMTESSSSFHVNDLTVRHYNKCQWLTLALVRVLKTSSTCQRDGVLSLTSCPRSHSCEWLNCGMNKSMPKCSWTSRVQEQKVNGLRNERRTLHPSLPKRMKSSSSFPKRKTLVPSMTHAGF